MSRNKSDKIKNTAKKVTAKKVNSRLYSAVAQMTPDRKDDILARCHALDQANDRDVAREMIPANVQSLRKIHKKEKRNSSIWQIAFQVAVVAAVLLLAFRFGLNQRHILQESRVDTVIDIDVNPSIEIKVNESERIVSVEALNRDAQYILEGMDLKGTQTTVAINAILGSMLSKGYLSENANSILVSVNANDQEKSIQVEQQVVANIDCMLQACSVDAAILSQTVEYDDETERLASQYGISVGRMILIQKIIDENGGYEISDLTKLTVNELNILLNSTQTSVSEVNSIGTVSESAYIGQEKAVQIALAHQGFDHAGQVEDLRCGLDILNSRMVYCIQYNVGNIQYGYKIDALNGSIVSQISGVPEGEKADAIDNSLTGQNGSEDSVSEDSVSENSISENSISENSISENDINENDVLGDSVSENEILENTHENVNENINDDRNSDILENSISENSVSANHISNVEVPGLNKMESNDGL